MFLDCLVEIYNNGKDILLIRYIIRLIYSYIS